MRAPSFISQHPLFTFNSLFCLFAPAYADISISNPIDNQLPDIARVGESFSWAFASDTFQAPGEAPLDYSATSLPPWLSFNNLTRTFSGTAESSDIGNSQITVIANDGSSSVSSTFTLCVTNFPPPTLNVPIASQFNDSNPSLSSVFLLSPGSALATGNPALRIPPEWSFSIGVLYNTFISKNNIFYDALLANGSALPDWLQFDTNEYTFDGVTPSIPQTVNLALHVSDQEGYTAESIPVDLIVSAHELWLAQSSLPTINVTTEAYFNLSLSSPDDFSGVMVDNNRSITINNISSLEIDVSQYSSWLKFDAQTMTLAGQPPLDMSSTGALPVQITAAFNQTLHTNVTIAVVQPFFSSPSLPAESVEFESSVTFDLSPYFSNKTSDSVNLMAAFDPQQASQYLTFNPSNATLTGTMPSGLSETGIDVSSTNPHITVTFTAYSFDTHSTSHTTLEMYFSGMSGTKFGSRIYDERLKRAIFVTLFVIGGLAVFGIILAAFRKCARVGDNALTGAAAEKAWSEKERKWYGLDLEDREMRWSNGSLSRAWSEKIGAKDVHTDISRASLSSKVAVTGSYGLLGPTPQSQSSQNVMRKGEFLGRIREAARNFSDTYRQPSPKIRRSAIGKPIPAGPVTLRTSHADAIDGTPIVNGHLENPELFADATFVSFEGIATASPSSTTDTRSIPRRRADFAPPRQPPVAMISARDVPGGENAMYGLPGSNSFDSLSQDSFEPKEAVVQVAHRVHSIRSMRSTSSLLHQHEGTATARPRLVPFTSASRVTTLSSADGGSGGPQRVPSQKATVVVGEAQKAGRVRESADELTMGAHYVRALGSNSGLAAIADEEVAKSPFSSPGASSSPASDGTKSYKSKSSFSSLETSNHGHDSPGELTSSRILVRKGEWFKFKVPLLSVGRVTSTSGLEMRLVNGGKLPGFLKAKGEVLKTARLRDAIEFSGVPGPSDLGKFEIGVYAAKTGQCMGTAVVDVVGKR